MAGPVIPTAVRMGTAQGSSVTPYQPPGVVPAGVGPQTTLPVSPNGLTPATDQSPQAVQQRTDAWSQFMNQLTQPGMSNSLLQFGSMMAARRQPGETGISHLLNAINATTSGWAGAQQQARQEGIRNAELGIKQQGAVNETTQTSTQQKAQQETARSNKEQEKIARERIKSTQTYYDALKEAALAKANGQPAADKMWDVAQKGLNAQLRGMENLLAHMDPESSFYADLMQEYRTTQNNYWQLVQQRDKQMGGMASAKPTSVTPADLTAFVQSFPDQVQQAKAFAASHGISWTPPNEVDQADYLKSLHSVPNGVVR